MLIVNWSFFRPQSNKVLDIKLQSSAFAWAGLTFPTISKSACINSLYLPLPAFSFLKTFWIAYLLKIDGSSWLFWATNLASGLERSYLRVMLFSPSSNENTSDIGLASSSAKKDPIFSLISNEGVSRASAPNLIKLFSIAFKSFFLRRSFLSQRSSNPEGNPGINFFSLFIFWYPGWESNSNLKFHKLPC